MDSFSRNPASPILLSAPFGHGQREMERRRIARLVPRAWLRCAGGPPVLLLPLPKVGESCSAMPINGRPPLPPFPPLPPLPGLYSACLLPPPPSDIIYVRSPLFPLFPTPTGIMKGAREGEMRYGSKEEAARLFVGRQSVRRSRERK